MRVLAFCGLSIALISILGMAGPRAAGCDPLGDVQFVCDQVGAEDLVLVPGSAWVVASGLAAGGAIRLINVRERTTTVLFPTASPRNRPDTKAYGSCPGPMDEDKEKFRAHGLYLRAGKKSLHTLYVVHHGNRESIEVFELDTGVKTPTLVWVGCAIAPESVRLNAVVALPDGGFAATNFQPRDKNGELWEWHTTDGWKIVPGSDASGANGLELSKDGKWFYIGAWGSQSFIRLSRGQTPVKRDDVALGFRIDNLRWAPDGTLFGAGQEGAPDGSLTKTTSHVVKINPETLEVRKIIRYPYNDVFSFATVAVQVGKEVWVGSVRGTRIARFPATQ